MDDDSLQATNLALRVLAAVNENRAPDPTDVAELSLMAPLLSHLPPDELACRVANDAIQRRQTLRLSKRWQRTKERGPN